MYILFQCIGNFCLLLFPFTSIFTIIWVSTLPAISAFICYAILMPTSGLLISFRASIVLDLFFRFLSDHFTLLGVTAGLIWAIGPWCIASEWLIPLCSGTSWLIWVPIPTLVFFILIMSLRVHIIRSLNISWWYGTISGSIRSFLNLTGCQFLQVRYTRFESFYRMLLPSKVWRIIVNIIFLWLVWALANVVRVPGIVAMALESFVFIHSFRNFEYILIINVFKGKFK